MATYRRTMEELRDLAATLRERAARLHHFAEACLAALDEEDRTVTATEKDAKILRYNEAIPSDPALDGPRHALYLKIKAAFDNLPIPPLTFGG